MKLLKHEQETDFYKVTYCIVSDQTQRCKPLRKGSEYREFELPIMIMVVTKSAVSEDDAHSHVLSPTASGTS